MTLKPGFARSQRGGRCVNSMCLCSSFVIFPAADFFSR